MKIKYLMLHTSIIIGMIFLACGCSRKNEVTETSSTTEISKNIKKPEPKKEVIIGNQKWSTVNLNESNFRNGEPIAQAKTDKEWKAAKEKKQPAWCYFEFDEANEKIYGKLYNWYAVSDSRNLAPVGWHIPSITEWKILIDYLPSLPAERLKSSSGWAARGSGTNSTGFNGLPGGSCDKAGLFGMPKFTGAWWSASEYTNAEANADGFSTKGDSYSAKNIELNYQRSEVEIYFVDKAVGCSVRCLKD